MTPGELALAEKPSWMSVVQWWDLTNSNMYWYKELYALHLSVADLSSPNAEPIAVMGDGAGNRKFVWRDSTWYQVDIDHKGITEPADLRKLIDDALAGAEFVCLVFLTPHVNARTAS